MIKKIYEELCSKIRDLIILIRISDVYDKKYENQI